MSCVDVSHLTHKFSNRYINNEKIGISFEIDRILSIGEDTKSEKWEFSLISRTDFLMSSLPPMFVLRVKNADISLIDSIDILLWLLHSLSIIVELINCTIDRDMLRVRRTFYGYPNLEKNIVYSS